MKKILMFAFALLIVVAFTTAGLAQEKAKAPEKPAAAEKAAAPEKAPAPEKAAAPEKDEKAEKPAKPKPKKPKAGFSGSVTAIDLAAKEMTVKGAKDSVTFDINGAALKGYKSVDQIKKGDKVLVKYKKDGIAIQKLSIKKAAPKAKAEKPAEEKPAAEEKK